MDLALSLVMLGAFALIVGSIVMWRRGAPRGRIVLALVLVVIAVGNVLLMTIPYQSGETPAEKAREAE